MLENLDLSRVLTNGEYKDKLRQLRPQLLRLQRACWNAGLGSLIVFEGWAFSGRGQAIRTLTQRLEPRGFVLNHVRAPRSHEAGLPWMWRFWESLPRFGQMAIYYGGWYRRVFVSRSQGLVSQSECEQAFTDINSFEKMLVDDRYLMTKFFFHIDLHEQSRRIVAAETDPLETWKLEVDDWGRAHSGSAASAVCGGDAGADVGRCGSVAHGGRDRHELCAHSGDGARRRDPDRGTARSTARRYRTEAKDGETGCQTPGPGRPDLGARPRVVQGAAPCGADPGCVSSLTSSTWRSGR